jgi:hypothetical protein
VNPGDEGDRCDSAQPFSAKIDSLPPETRNSGWVERDMGTAGLPPTADARPG